MNVRSITILIGTTAAVLLLATVAWVSSRRTAGDSTGLRPPINQTARDAKPLHLEPPPIVAGIPSKRLPFDSAADLGSVERPGEGNGVATGDEPAEPYMEASGSPETWTLEYAEFDVEHLMQESEEITAYVTSLAREDLVRRWELGRYETVSTDGTMKMTHDDAKEFFPGLALLVHRQDKEVRRYQVAESEYPELYALARKGAWLSEEAQKMTLEKRQLQYKHAFKWSPK